jgi:hypothetical protein
MTYGKTTVSVFDEATLPSLYAEGYRFGRRNACPARLPQAVVGDEWAFAITACTRDLEGI